MAFVRGYADGDPISIDNFINNDNELVCTFPIGFDDETDFSYSLMLALSPNPGGTYEFVFVLTSKKPDEDEPIPAYDGSRTRAQIANSEDRAYVLGLICMAVGEMVEKSSASIIFMTTHTADLPEHALRKFYIIAQAFEDNGFEVGRADSYHGRYIWMMKRIP